MTQPKLPSRFGPGAFRLFLASVVVVHHSFPLRMGSWAVYVFFILSGYWISLMWQKKYVNTKTPWLTFCVSRWWRLAPVFLTCTLLGALSSKLLHQEAPQLEQWSWWLRQLIVVGSSSAGRILPPSWSLDVEMQFYLLAPALLALMAVFPARGRFLLVLGGFAYMVMQLVHGIPAETARLDLYLGCFAGGLWLQQTRWRPSPLAAYGSLAAFFILTAAFLILPASRGGIWIRGDGQELQTNTFVPGWPHIWWALGALMVLPFVAHNVSQVSSKRDRWLGNLAFPLYMIHWIARDWYYKYVDWSRPMSHNLLLLGASWLAAYAAAIIILLLIDQPIDRLRAQWVNGREISKLAASTQATDTLSGP